MAKATIIEATGDGATVEGVTVSEALPLFDPRVAMIAAAPGDIAVTSPEAETVATAALLELQTTGWFTTRFRESRRSAFACVAWPTSSEL